MGMTRLFHWWLYAGSWYQLEHLSYNVTNITVRELHLSLLSSTDPERWEYTTDTREPGSPPALKVLLVAGGGLGDCLRQEAKKARPLLQLL